MVSLKKSTAGIFAVLFGGIKLKKTLELVPLRGEKKIQAMPKHALGTS